MTLNTFFEKFALFADAPDAVEKMRELILLLALDGKIGETNATTWPRIQLGDLGEWGSGGTPLSSESRYYDGNIPWLIIGDLNDGVVTSSMKTITEEGLANSSARMLPKGVLLIAMYGSIGKLGITDIECATNQAIAFCKPDPKKADLRYLFHAFMGLRPKFLSRGQGLAQKNISQRILRAWEIGLPPLAEQKRIVAKVDELMALCDRLEAQQQEREQQHTALSRASLARFADAPTPANLQLLFQKSYTISPADLRKSILTLAVQGKLVAQDPNDEPAEELFGRIERTKEKLITERTIKRVAVEANPSGDECESLPPGWLWTRLGNSFDVRDGTHDTPKYTTEGFPLITSKNIYSGSLLFDGANLISEKDHRQISERSRVDRRDILFAMIGSIGNPVIVDTDREFSIKNVALFKYYTSADSEPRFLLLYLQLVAAEMKAKAAGGVQSFVSLGFLRNYLFPLPPLAEQRRIVAKVDQLMALVDALETQLSASRATAKNLLDALVAELTSGSQKAS
jgi:type I restriction enzyme S subunit